MYKGRIIDVDIHHTWRSEAELLEYLPHHWREYFALAQRGPRLSVSPATLSYSAPGASYTRFDAEPPGGSSPGSDYAFMREQLLDPLNVERGLLTYDIGSQGAFHNPEAAVALCSACNDWCIDQWLSDRDDRLYSTVLVPTATPNESAMEIRRVGRHPRMAGVLMVPNPLLRPFGHPVYHPIYEAAVEVGLPVIFHLGSEVSSKGTFSAGGVPNSQLESYILLEQPAMHHVTSLIVGGVFEKYPELRVLFDETGFSWYPWLLWRLDAHYNILRRESPHMRRLPSDYFRDHMWVSTQPFDTTSEPERMLELLELFGGMEDRLCFSSDYPHWDADEPTHIAARLPKSWLPKVFAENAAKLFGWPQSSNQAATPSVADRVG